MTSDDDVIARLRASLQATAEATPIGAGRFADIAAAPSESHNRALVTVVSAAAAVAAIAAASSVAFGSHSGASHAVAPAAEGSLTPTAAPAPVPSASAATVGSSRPSAQAAPGGVAPTATPGRAAAAANCVPENYYVIASPSELTGLTYMLPAPPAGYTLYGAWGTISGNHCAASATWYVEYDSTERTDGATTEGATSDGTNSIQLTVTRVDGDGSASFDTPTPVAATPITINGNEAAVVKQGGDYELIGWAAGGAQIAVAGPTANGDVSSLVILAQSLTLLSPYDSRIVMPIDCQVPPGSVCGSDSPMPSPSASTTAMPSPSASASAAPSPSASASAAPSPTENATATASPSSTAAARGGASGTAEPVPSPNPNAVG